MGTLACSTRQSLKANPLLLVQERQRSHLLGFPPITSSFLLPHFVRCFLRFPASEEGSCPSCTTLP